MATNNIIDDLLNNGGLTKCRYCGHRLRDIHTAPFPARNARIDVLCSEVGCDCVRNIGLGDLVL